MFLHQSVPREAETKTAYLFNFKTSRGENNIRNLICIVIILTDVPNMRKDDVFGLKCILTIYGIVHNKKKIWSLRWSDYPLTLNAINIKYKFDKRIFF